MPGPIDNAGNSAPYSESDKPITTSDLVDRISSGDANSD